MTTLSYSLVVFRVKKSEMGKVTTTTRKESSSRMRERPASAGSGSGGLFAIASQILVFLGNPTILETFACPHQNLSFGPTSNLVL